MLYSFTRLQPGASRAIIKFCTRNKKYYNIVARMSSSAFPVTDSIRQKLTEAFNPIHLEVLNESHMHNVPKDSETHFKVVVVSSRFDDVKSPLQRHRLINGTLASELDGPVHALSIVAKSPAQWEKNQSVPPSPTCKGGDGSLPKRSETS